ncbi:hypothetical protein J437_LFUL019226 [Ladona fulva]|uniref:Gag-like protein n=1 Tax=Ladona fulva TaxID=123851 RepID=A0A8K0PBC0_LADFU|nr:hypothetical protein J437_LFUL019226 [Ladona fulva]
MQAKVPPIYLENAQNWVPLFKKLCAVCTMQPFAQMAGRKVLIKCSTTNDFIKVRDILINDILNFFTDRLSTEKNHNFIIRGLPTMFLTEDTVSSLEELGLLICKVTQLKTTRPMRSVIDKGINSVPPRPLLLFQVEIPDSSLLDKFLSIKNICGFKIKIEKFKPPSGPPQCHRCQQYGHVDKARQMSVKCVKCGQNHHTRECKKPASEPAVCINCKGSHPASYRGCPV